MAASITTIRIGIVGVGKIVRDQHLPALAKNSDYQLVATASRNASVDGVASFQTIEEMLAGVPDLDAVSLCMPPQYRYRAAHTALQAGKHVFLEKPPGATVSEVEDLKALAAEKGVSLFASWHSRYAPAVEAARNLPCLEPANCRCDQLEGRCPALAPQPGMDLAGGRARRVRPRHQRAVDHHAHLAEGAVRHRRRRSNSRKIATHRLPLRSRSAMPTGWW